MKNVSEIIKNGRQQKKITQKELADKLGVTKYSVAKYEQGQRQPSLNMMKKIIEVLDLKIDEVYEYQYVNNNEIELQPNVDSLIYSLRNIGYTIESAIADIVDNSISANASKIEIDFIWKNEKSKILIKDNGIGMNDTQLLEAMKFGSYKNKENINYKSLNRFGMGLKTASFSQAKVLRVVTKSINADVIGMEWDIDKVINSKSWQVSKVIPEDYMISSNGTIVEWHNLDKLIYDKDKIISQLQFCKIMNRVQQYLQLYFHKYLNDIDMYVNSIKLEYIDIFQKKSIKTKEFPIKKIDIEDSTITIQSYIVSDLIDNLEQGFYIYRNGRLIKGGSWCNLFKNESRYEGIRIEVNIPITMDENTNINIQKNKIQMPNWMKNELKEEGYRIRGKIDQLISKNRINKCKDENKIDKCILYRKLVNDEYTYNINRNHSIIQNINKKYGKCDDIENLLSSLEAEIKKINKGN